MYWLPRLEAELENNTFALKQSSPNIRVYVRGTMYIEIVDLKPNHGVTMWDAGSNGTTYRFATTGIADEQRIDTFLVKMQQKLDAMQQRNAAPSGKRSYCAIQ